MVLNWRNLIELFATNNALVRSRLSEAYRRNIPAQPQIYSIRSEKIFNSFTKVINNVSIIFSILIILSLVGCARSSGARATEEANILFVETKQLMAQEKWFDAYHNLDILLKKYPHTDVAVKAVELLPELRDRLVLCNIMKDLNKYPQSTVEECANSVLGALNERAYEYMITHLLSERENIENPEDLNARKLAMEELLQKDDKRLQGLKDALSAVVAKTASKKYETLGKPRVKIEAGESLQFVLIDGLWYLD